ncbi:MAG: hypothetical protein PVG41_22060, partial [Desulfobacteraceae bacterium]
MYRERFHAPWRLILNAFGENCMFILLRRLFPPVAADRHFAKRERPVVSMIAEIAVHPGPVSVSVQQELCFVVRPDHCLCRPAAARVESWMAATMRPWGPAEALSVVKLVLEPALQHQVLARAAVEPLRVGRIQARGMPSLVLAAVQGLVC